MSASGSPGKKLEEPGAASSADEEQISEMAFLRWKTELQNRLIVEQEKRLADERKAYKQREDAKFNERKQNLHARTSEEFGNSKQIIETLREANLERGREYQADLHEMRQKIAYQKEEWRDFGHELTVQHGTEQVERTRARIAESLEVKAEAGRQVKIETDVNNKAIRNERITNLEQKHKYVEALKREKIGKLEESLQ